MEALQKPWMPWLTIYDGKAEILDLSHAKSKNRSSILHSTLGRLGRFFRRTTNQEIDDFAINLIAQAYARDPSILTGCTVLNLANNYITDVGAQILADVLEASKCNLHTLHIDGNPVGLDGLRELQRALQKNITLCEFSYEELGVLSSTETEEFIKIRENIATQLLINSKLRGRVLDSQLVAVTKLPGDHESLQRELAQMAQDKLRSNPFVLSGISSAMAAVPEIKSFLEQNEIFLRLFRSPTAGDLLQAFSKNPPRFREIMSMPGQHSERVTKQLRDIITSSKLEMALFICKENSEQLLEILAPNGDVQNIKLLTTVARQMLFSKFEIVSDIPDYVLNYLDMLWGKLANSPGRFRYQMRKNRSQIAKNEAISEAWRGRMLDAFDGVLNPELSMNQLRIYQLTEMLGEYPAGRESVVFENLIKHYRNFSAEERQEFWKLLSARKMVLAALLKKIIWLDVNSCAQLFDLLRTIPLAPRLEFLEAYFRVQGDGVVEIRGKAAAISTMLDGPGEVFDGYGRDYNGSELFYCFSAGRGVFGRERLGMKALRQHLQQRESNLESTKESSAKWEQLNAIARVLDPALLDEKKLHEYRWHRFISSYSKSKATAVFDDFVHAYKDFSTGEERRSALGKMQQNDLIEFFIVDAPNFTRWKRAQLGQESWLDLFNYILVTDEDHGKEKALLLAEIFSHSGEVMQLWDKKANFFKKYDAMRQELRRQRITTAKNAKDYGQGDMRLDSYNRLLHADDDLGQALARRARQWLTEYPKDLTASQVFSKFVEFYRKLPEEKLLSVFHKSAVDDSPREQIIGALIKLLQDGIKTNYLEILDSLRKLPEEYRRILLTNCFRSYPREQNSSKKARLVSRMVDISAGMFDTAGAIFRRNYDGMEIYYSLTALTNDGIYTSDDLVNVLSRRWVNIILSGNGEKMVAELSAIDWVLYSEDYELSSPEFKGYQLRKSLELAPKELLGPGSWRYFWEIFARDDFGTRKKVLSEVFKRGPGEQLVSANLRRNLFALLCKFVIPMAAEAKEIYEELFREVFHGEKYSHGVAAMVVKYLDEFSEGKLLWQWLDGYRKNNLNFEDLIVALKKKHGFAADQIVRSARLADLWHRYPRASYPCSLIEPKDDNSLIAELRNIYDLTDFQECR